MSNWEVARKPAARAIELFALLAAVVLATRLDRPARVSAEDRVEPAASNSSEPNASAILAKHAAAALQKGNYDKALVLLRTAITLNPNDAGADYDPWALEKMDRHGVDHGYHQLDRMLADRPLMETYLRATDGIHKWTALTYGEQISGAKIEWDPSATRNLDTDAENVPPWSREPGKIRIRDVEAGKMDRAHAFEILWWRAAFELHNIQNAKDFWRVDARARNWSITENDYVRSMFLLEFRAAQRTRKWYVDVFLPHAKKYQLPTDPANWYCDRWLSPESEFALYSNRNHYPWVPYLGDYKTLAYGLFAH